MEKHLRNIGHKYHEKEHKIEHSATNVSRNSNSDGHSMDDMVVLRLLFADKDATKRKTLLPHGLYKLFSFIS